ncbi:MAG: endo-1,4-beta-xylanase, partial [Brevundimonas sp.]
MTGFAASPILTAFGAGGLATEAGVARRPSTPGGRLFGAAVRMDQIEADPDLRRTLLSDCASVTPEIHMKWDSLQPSADAWRTGPADALVAFADRHGLLVRGHTLLWDQSTPAWARERMLATRDPSIVDRYFDAVLGRYDTVVEWDVVNEPIDTENG